ncbi:MAG: hypothetical protein ACTSR5_12385 [Promethearchaeota archaeon]
MSENIWVSGPKELIEHALSLVKTGKDSDLRIAMICVDNATEIMIKSYLSLNKRILGIHYKEYYYGIEKFPRMLNLLQKYLIQGEISLDELDKIEFLHSIRNNLYHSGTGISIIKSFVNKYILLARDLLSRLFNFDIHLKTDDLSKIQGEFLQIFRNIEVNLKNFALTENLIPLISKPYTIAKIMSILLNSKKVSYKFANKFAQIFKFRNEYIHGLKEPSSEEIEIKMIELKEINDDLLEFMNK